MLRLLGFGGLAIFLLAAPLLIEYATEGEEFEWIDFSLDVLDLLISAAAIATVALLVSETRDLRRVQETLVNDLWQTRAENREWREAEQQKIDGFRSAIEAQFENWSLSQSEQDVAVLLLKGCSHKQIAKLRGGSDTTVRQHAQAVYRKSGLKNRSELAAYFLDAVLAPNSS